MYPNFESMDSSLVKLKARYTDESPANALRSLSIVTIPSE